MKTRNWLAMASGALLTFSILSGAYLAPHARAQSPSTFTICLHDDTGQCIRSFGAGQGTQLWSSDYAVFHVVNTSSGGQKQMENAAGNCLRVYSDDSVRLAFGSCDSTNDAEWWIRSEASNGRITYESKKYRGQFIGTLGTSNGIVVQVGPPQPGLYTGWFECC